MSNAIGLGGAPGQAAVGQPFSIGRTFGDTLSVFRQGFGKFFAVTAIAHIPLLIVGVLAAAIPGGAGAGAIIAPFVQLIVGPISTAACLYGAYQIMIRRSFSLGEAFSVAFSRFWALIGVSLIGGLLTGLLVLLLIVPGVIYACMIFVAQPACVIERLGPNGSLRRSRELTKGYRWQVFAVFIFVSVAAALAAGAGITVVTLLIGPVAGAVGQFVVQAFIGAFSAVLYAVTYSGLREAKEGVSVDELASVFD
jgi:hypothetical protein